MKFTSPLKSNSKKIMLLGSGELGKEVVIEASRLSLETISVDKYANAPAHLVANKSYVIDMLDKEALLEVIRREKPDYILPEIEAINIEALFQAEKEGFNIIPNASTVSKTMNRKQIREFASCEVGLKTSKYKFVKSLEELKNAVKKIGYPCVIKPVMSSSGHGQSMVRQSSDIPKSWEIAKQARGNSDELIVEEFVKFDYEITLLTIKNDKKTVYCEPIGHQQKDGDYIFSWQPHKMKKETLKKAQQMAKKITNALCAKGGRGLFGVEFFIKNDEVYFSELSPRPHDTGLVTLITQSQSEFALHIRAILGLPLGYKFITKGVSGAYKAKTSNHSLSIIVPKKAYSKNSYMYIFGKPNAHKGRRLGVVLVRGAIKKALKKAKKIIGKIIDK